jgi:Tol biopolymer transport system component
MVLWTSPPEPSSVLGRYRDWGELVAVHEEAHLVHLLRPARNPWQRLVGRLVPAGGLGPIPRRAPRWVSEGYATLLEGRLTGSGRPSSDLRAAVLRQRALAGRLPSYGALGRGDESWLGRSMAYLVGSTYLRWLEGRATGPEGSPREGALRDVWARMTARRDRGFDDAFRGVFGEGPAELYGRFTAELTWRAMEAERRLGGPDRPGVAREGTGELWLDLSWGTGAPAVSPDGARIAAVVRARERPARLTVWETAPDPEAEVRREEERRKLLERDPEDVPAVQVGPPPREPVATLPAFDGREPLDPRFSPDGGSLLFAALGPDGDGFLRADLYRWVLQAGDSGEVERLTRLADLRSPDPLPGGPPRAVAVRNRHGFSQLVVVDLGTGAVRPLTEPSVEEVWATPRVSPDGTRLAGVRLREGTWRLMVAALEGGDGEEPALGEVRELPTPEGATVADPAWGPGGRTLYAAVGTGGFLDVWAFDLSQEVGETRGRPLTRTLGAALAPAPTPDGEALFYLALEHDGLDIRRVELAGAEQGAEQGAGREPLPAELAPAILPPAEAESEPFAEVEPPEDRPYGPGPQEVTPLVGLALAPAGLALEAGVRGGDVVGRLDWLLLGSAGDAGAVEGGVLAAAWRGLPVELSAAAFSTSEEPSAQDSPPPGAGRSLDTERTGLALAAGWDRRFPAGAAALRLGLLGAEVEPLGPGKGEGVETRAATLRAGLAWAPSRDAGASPSG